MSTETPQAPIVETAHGWSSLGSSLDLVVREAKRPVGVIFAKHRTSVRLDGIASFRKTITTKLLKECQFPDEIVDANGRTIRRPDEWR